MTEKEKRQQRQSTEDVIFNKMLLWLVGVILAEAVVLFVKRFYIDITGSDLDISMAVALSGFFRIFSYVGLVLTAFGIAWCVVWNKKGKALRLPLICTVVVAFIWVLSLLAYLLYDSGVKIMMALPIVGAVLILIYFLYQRAFFVNSILSGCGMAALWCFRQFYSGHPTVVTLAFVVGWIVLIAIAVLAYFVKKNGGKLGKLRLVSDQKSYTACWLTCAVVLVATLLGLIFGAAVAYYLIYVLIGWLFCLAVYYTVKLM